MQSRGLFVALQYYYSYMLSWHGQGQLYLLYLPYVNSVRVTKAYSSLVRHIDIFTVGKWRMASVCSPAAGY